MATGSYDPKQIPVLKDKETTGALIPLAIRSGFHGCPNRGYGSSTFSGVEKGAYTEKTISLSVENPTIDPRTGKYDAAFEVERLGDLAHTFVLKMPVGDGLFDSFELRHMSGAATAAGKMIHRERVSFEANRALAGAFGWHITDVHDPFASEITMPLMLRETVDWQRTYLPLIAENPDNGQYIVHELVVRGLASAEIARGIRLEVDYAYLDTTARRKLAQCQVISLFMPTCDYHSHTFRDLVSTGDDKPIRVRIPSDSPIRNLIGVTGLMFSSCCGYGIQALAFYVNGHRHSAWTTSDGDSSWKKAGLQNPHNGTTFLPFSRNALLAPDKAAFIDFIRMDKLEIEVWGKISAFTVTALGHRTRWLDVSRIHVDGCHDIDKAFDPCAFDHANGCCSAHIPANN